LVVATGAIPSRPPIDGLDRYGPADGVHLLHTMGDTHAIMASITERPVGSAVIVGAGYIGLEMAEALTARDIAVTQVEQLPEVLPTVDPELGLLVAEQLRTHGVDVRTSTRIASIERKDGRLVVHGAHTQTNEAFVRTTDLVLVVTGVKPDTALAAATGIPLTSRGAIQVDHYMRTGLPDVYAAGDCVLTHHRLLGETYLPLGTTAHKQGRVAGENAIGGQRRFAGSLGTQAVKVFDLVAARTGIRDHEAAPAGYARTGQLLGVQMVGAIATAVHKRIDTAATAIFRELTIDEVSDLDLSYTPPLGSPWDVLQAAAQLWARKVSPQTVPSSS
jgi:NADPH-dependent 2,4-dienoyl-CoA reductase/sulfur reductase-like enzyme